MTRLNKHLAGLAAVTPPGTTVLLLRAMLPIMLQRNTGSHVYPTQKRP